MANLLKYTMMAALGVLLQMCSASVPDNARKVPDKPRITPDYADLDVPVNIAPLNFTIDEKGDKYVTRLRNGKGDEIVVDGKTTDFDIDRWHNLLEASRGDTVYVDVYAHTPEGWKQYEPLKYFVAEEIDPYISYRYIEPLYVNYEVLSICQRNLENFDESVIYNNCPYLDTEGDRQCMNCHSYQNYNREGNMQLHIRVVNPGTVIMHNGTMRKVNLKVGRAFSAGAYLSWHPSLPYIAYSVNDTWQHFHSVDPNKVEVQDAASDLILYNIDTNTVTMVAETDSVLETFPYWSPDGKSLYYVAAKVPKLSQHDMANYRQTNYRDIKYDIMRKPFNASDGTFGATDTVFMASAAGMSATFPRETPDGRYLLFTMAEYGTFHNFHHDADLYLMDLAEGSVRALDEVNSPDTESYHSFSSNGRWILFSSRRDNGSYTRLYLAHFDGNGHASKPFLLPQRTPYINDLNFRSFNVPEFMVRPVEISRSQWLDAVDAPAVDANFKD